MQSLRWLEQRSELLRIHSRGAVSRCDGEQWRVGQEDLVFGVWLLLGIHAASRLRVLQVSDGAESGRFPGAGVPESALAGLRRWHGGVESELPTGGARDG